MPDLTPEAFYHCVTAEDWSRTVIGSKGDEYTVTWNRHDHKNDSVQYDYACNCKGYTYYGPKYCKHIREASRFHCNWDAFLNHLEVDEKEGRKCCPLCGSDVKVTLYAV